MLYEYYFKIYRINCKLYYSTIYLRLQINQIASFFLNKIKKYF